MYGTVPYRLTFWHSRQWNWSRRTSVILFNVLFSMRIKVKHYLLLNSPLACVCVLMYESYIFVRCFWDFTSGGRKLTKRCNLRTGIYCASGPTGADGSCTTPDDPMEPKERRRHAISSSEGKRNRAVGIKCRCGSKWGSKCRILRVHRIPDCYR